MSVLVPFGLVDFEHRPNAVAATAVRAVFAASHGVDARGATEPEAMTAVARELRRIADVIDAEAAKMTSTGAAPPSATLTVSPADAQLACSALGRWTHHDGSAPHTKIDELRERLGAFIKANGLWP